MPNEEEKLTKDEKEEIEALKKALAKDGIKIEDYKKDIKASEELTEKIKHRLKRKEAFDPVKNKAEKKGG